MTDSTIFIHYNASTVPMADSFPIKLGFYITVPKCQGRSIHKLIPPLSEHPTNFLKLCWKQLYTYTILSCITEHYDLRLFLYMGSINTLQYIYIYFGERSLHHIYFAGYPKESSNEVLHWNPILAAKVAGFSNE